MPQFGHIGSPFVKSAVIRSKKHFTRLPFPPFRYLYSCVLQPAQYTSTLRSGSLDRGCAATTTERWKERSGPNVPLAWAGPQLTSRRIQPFSPYPTAPASSKSQLTWPSKTNAALKIRPARGTIAIDLSIRCARGCEYLDENCDLVLMGGLEAEYRGEREITIFSDPAN